MKRLLVVEGLSVLLSTNGQGLKDAAYNFFLVLLMVSRERTSPLFDLTHYISDSAQLVGINQYVIDEPPRQPNYVLQMLMECA